MHWKCAPVVKYGSALWRRQPCRRYSQSLAPARSKCRWWRRAALFVPAAPWLRAARAEETVSADMWVAAAPPACVAYYWQGRAVNYTGRCAARCPTAPGRTRTGDSRFGIRVTPRMPARRPVHDQRNQPRTSEWIQGRFHKSESSWAPDYSVALYYISAHAQNSRSETRGKSPFPAFSVPDSSKVFNVSALETVLKTE